MYDPDTSVRNRSSTEPSLSTSAQTQRAKVEDREMDESVLPKRSGSKPTTTPTNPHTQLKQNPKREVVEELARRAFAIPSVQERPSTTSVPGARAL
jgi:transglutaminase/protease-like cytokinesis protein 3